MVITLVIDDILSVNKADVGVIVMLPNEYSSSRTDRGTHVLLLPGITSIVTVAVTSKITISVQKKNNVDPTAKKRTRAAKNKEMKVTCKYILHIWTPVLAGSEVGEEHGEGQQVGGDQVLGPQLYQPDTECGICHISL